MADTDSHVIQIFNPDGTCQIIGTYDEANQLHFPKDVVSDTQGNIYVTQSDGTEEFHITKFNANGSYITAFPVGATSTYGITIDQNDIIYTLTNQTEYPYGNTVKTWTTEGILLSEWNVMGGGGSGIAVDEKGYVYISFPSMNYIRKYR